MVQSAILIATEFQAVTNGDWLDFRAKWFHTVYTEPSITSLGKRIKEFAKAVQNHAIQNLLQDVPSREFYRLLKNDKICQMVDRQLRQCGIRLEQIPRDLMGPGRQKAAFVTAEICQTRYLPGPNLKEVMDELASLKERIAGPREFVATPLAFDSLTAASLTLGQELALSKRFDARKCLESSHLSLSNSGCIEYTRRQGGKFAILQNEFYEFLMQPVSYFFNEETWDARDGECSSRDSDPETCSPPGHRPKIDGYRDNLGNLIALSEYGHHEVWRIAYVAEPIEGEFREKYAVNNDNGNALFHCEKGIDCRLGMLLFLWSNVMYNEWVKEGCPPLPVDPVPISEPGVKARIATKSKVWINLYLSPAGHVITDIMSSMPGSRLGLTGADHAWNFEAAFGNHAHQWKSGEIEAISTSDLTAATDYLEHNLARDAMKAFLDGVEFAQSISFREYLDKAIELHCSPT